MFVASDNINSLGQYEWAVIGDSGAIEVPDSLGHELINRAGGHYWATDGAKPAPKRKATPKAEPELQEDESTGDDIADALDASNVGARPKSRARKTTKE